MDQPIQDRVAEGGIADRFVPVLDRDLAGQEGRPAHEPWILVAGASGTAPAYVPPSGHVAGIYARVDLELGEHVAPGNANLEGLVVNDPLRPSLAYAISHTDSSARINPIRAFPGKGTLVWGARTMSGNPEWKYVNVRRYLLYLEHSIDRGIQWAVFEPNAEPLWRGVRTTINNFLTLSWRGGALQSVKLEEAAFVRCGADTMTQDDLDNGRLVCLVGVAMLKASEFVIIRTGLRTADDDEP